jgi:hypothetical protein
MTGIPLSYAEFRAPLNSGQSTTRIAVFLPELGVVEVEGDLIPLHDVRRMRPASPLMVEVPLMPYVPPPTPEPDVATRPSAARASRGRTSQA